MSYVHYLTLLFYFIKHLSVLANSIYSNDMQITLYRVLCNLVSRFVQESSK